MVEFDTEYCRSFVALQTITSTLALGRRSLSCSLHHAILWSSSSLMFFLLLPTSFYPLLLSYYLFLIHCFFGVQYLYVAGVLNAHVHHGDRKLQTSRMHNHKIKIAVVLTTLWLTQAHPNKCRSKNTPI